VDAALVIALIALAGSIFSTLVSTFGAPVFQGRRDARALLDTYREPLLAAAFELQSRLHNILRTGFLDEYVASDDKGKQDAAVASTLYVFAQYFGWTEIIRREIRFLRFASTKETREIARLMRDVGEAFLTDGFGTQLMIWRVEQRAIGERMIDSSNGKLVCRGYASFLEHRDELKTWLDPVERDMLALDDGGRKRLVEVQHLLLRLVRELDPEQVRYPFELSEA
jgi:hypothetical protein